MFIPTDIINLIHTYKDEMAIYDLKKYLHTELKWKVFTMGLQEVCRHLE